MRETKIAGLLTAIIVFSGFAYGQTQTAPGGSEVKREALPAEDRPLLDLARAQDAPSDEPPVDPPKPQWHYGGFIDLGYLLAFNHPSNHLFRSRGTIGFAEG